MTLLTLEQPLQPSSFNSSTSLLQKFQGTIVLISTHCYSFFSSQNIIFCTQDMNILINCFIFISHLTLFFPADSHTAIDALLKIHCQRRLSSSLNSLCPRKAASCSQHQALTSLFNCFSTPTWYLRLPPTPVFLI